jgi:uncharacterized protein YggU (UPF0235/DUF167 family)
MVNIVPVDIVVDIWVKPGAARPGVGGAHDGALIVRVPARAVDGKATEAALAALADALGIRRRDAVLIGGAISRRKRVHISGDAVHLNRRLAELLDPQPDAVTREAPATSTDEPHSARPSQGDSA